LNINNPDKIELRSGGLRIARYRHDTANLLHCHQYVEVVFIYGGSAMHEINSSRCPISSGDILIINIGDIHRFSDCSALQIWNVIIPREIIMCELDKLALIPGFHDLIQPDVRLSKRYEKPIHVNAGEMKIILSRIKNAEICLHNPSVAKEIISRSDIVSILAWITERYINSAGRVLNQKPAPLLIRQAIELLAVEDKTPAISEIAAKAGLSAEHFIRLFKKYTGVPPLKYRQRLCIEKAVEFFSVDPELSVAAAATACGFGTVSYFGKIFKKITGHTPVRFKEKCKY